MYLIYNQTGAYREYLTNPRRYVGNGFSVEGWDERHDAKVFHSLGEVLRLIIIHHSIWNLIRGEVIWYERITADDPEVRELHK